MDIRSMGASALRARINAAQEDLSAAFSSVISRPDYLPECLGTSSVIGYHNPEVYALIDQMAGAVDPDDLDWVYRQLSEMLRDDLPVTFLMPRIVTFITHRRLYGLSHLFRAVPARHMEDLWIEERE